MQHIYHSLDLVERKLKMFLNVIGIHQREEMNLKMNSYSKEKQKY